MRHFVIRDVVKETLAYAWNLLYDKITYKFQVADIELAEIPTCKRVCRQIIDELDLLGINTEDLDSYLEVRLHVYHLKVGL